MTPQGSRAPTRHEWMRIHEACGFISVSPATLRRWGDAGDIKAVTTPGRQRWFTRAAVIGLDTSATTELLEVTHR